MKIEKILFVCYGNVGRSQMAEAYYNHFTKSTKAISAGTDKILNLKEINIVDVDNQSSSSCSSRVIFNIDCETKKGYCEDPDFTGRMEVLDVKKDNKESNVYTLKVKFVKDEEENGVDKK